jgi:hypothetical protein
VLYRRASWRPPLIGRAAQRTALRPFSCCPTCRPERRPVSRVGLATGFPTAAPTPQTKRSIGERATEFRPLALFEGPPTAARRRSASRGPGPVSACPTMVSSIRRWAARQPRAKIPGLHAA